MSSPPSSHSNHDLVFLENRIASLEAAIRRISSPPPTAGGAAPARAAQGGSTAVVGPVSGGGEAIRVVPPQPALAGPVGTSRLTVGAGRILGRATAGTGSIEELVCTAAGRALLDDASAPAQRATLGLGTAATAALTDFAPALVAVLTTKSDLSTAANTAPISLTDLVFNYETKAIYRVWAMGRVSPVAGTTGCGFQLDLSSSFESVNLMFFHQLANTGTLSGGHSIADDASVGVSSGMPGTSTYPVVVFGLFSSGNGISGTAQLRFRSETTAVTTCKAGFTMVVERLN